MRTAIRIMTWGILASLAVPALAGFSASRQGEQAIVRGNHFRVTIDATRGGEIADIRLFDGSQWNRVLGADGQTCPRIDLRDESGEYSLANDNTARIERFDAGPEVIRFQTVGHPRSSDGKSSPWLVKLSYEVYPQGAVFIDVDYTLDEGATVSLESSMSLIVDRSVTRAAKYRQLCRHVGPGKRVSFPSARVAFGVNPRRSFTNEIEAIVEYRTPLGGATAFRETVGGLTWTLADGKVDLHAPLHYHNRFSLGLGSGVTGMGKPTTNLVAQRMYAWLYMGKSIPRHYPTNGEIDKMIANGATMLHLHRWLQTVPHANGHPHARYVPLDEKKLIRTIAHAHQKRLRVNVYMRALERYGLDQKFFEKYLKRNWDGIFIDWHGACGIVYHEQTWQAEPAVGDVHFSKDGSYVPARAYFRFARRLRQVVGPRGHLIGHQGSFNTGVLANLGFDAYLPGETASDHAMLSNRDEAVFAGMMGGGLSMPYPLSPGFHTPEAVAKMAAWGLQPMLHLSLVLRRLSTPEDPDDPANGYLLPSWRILQAIDADHATVYNLPSVNQVAATCSRPDFHCLVYKENKDYEESYLVIVANLGTSIGQTEIALVPEVLGMQGEYRVSRINPVDGAASPDGTTKRLLKSGPLPPSGFEGIKLGH